jgi:hypothetical protein
MPESRNSVEDIWGDRTPFRGQGKWPQRVDYRVTEEPERWVQSACVLCSNGCGTERFPKLSREEAYMIASVAVDYNIMSPR